MKLLYVATLADEVLSKSIPDILSRQVLLRHILENENIKIYYGESGYGPITSRIDHQSQYVLPMNWSGETYWSQQAGFIDIEFLKEFRDYFLQDNLAIIGGNDNYESNYSDFSNTFTLPIPKDVGGEWVARKDPTYNYWTLFNRNDGTKVRFSFDNIKKNPERAFAPELLDIKITEKCPFANDKSDNSKILK